MESGFPLTLNFATLYLGKIESLHFQHMKDCIHYRVIRYVLPNLLPTVVPSSCYCYPLSLLYTHPTSTTLFPILSKQSILVLSFEYLTDNSNEL
jgi:hypothetical protein